MNQGAQDLLPPPCGRESPADKKIKPLSPSKETSATPLRFPVSRNPIFTGTRLAQRNPEKYLAILDALKRGERVMQIAKRLRCSQHTVLGIRERAGDHLPLPTRMTSSLMAQLIHSSPERMEQVMARMSSLKLINLSYCGMDRAMAIEKELRK